ncbi:MAG: hypothetical protein CL927_17485 [Deltaproteobacteria bacterium]|nr:hypothetical protein [Deltaproteobacteria bacterium]HCH66198.1 hypothetical protein [Deltaproteobacteria bacterium]
MSRSTTTFVLPMAMLVACSQSVNGDLKSPEGANLSGMTDVDADSDGFTADTDCDDANDRVFPGAVERCDGIDNNCNGLVDDADPALDLSTAERWFVDGDADGYGDMSERVLACDQPAGAVLSGADCDDANSSISPDATEICDGVDNNCNDAIDDDDPTLDPSSQSTWYLDADSDGFGSADTPLQSCARPDGAVDNDRDCDDENATVNPDAAEVCDTDNLDEDCNGVANDEDSGVDPDSQSRSYVDADGDGYGDESDDGVLSCTPPADHVLDHTDCDDDNIDISPEAIEICDTVDNNCNGDIDDEDATVDPSSQTRFYTDADTDGYGADTATGVLYCDGPSGTAASNTDCDDGAASVNPGATEICNGVDDDCDARTTEAGLVAFESRSGVFTDLAASFGGTSTSADRYTTTANGTLWFCDGTFYTHLTVEHDLTIAPASGIVVLDGTDSGRVVNVETNGLTVDIDNVVIQHGYAQYGGGVACVGSNSTTVVSLNNVELSNNEAFDVGGGALAWSCELDINDSTIADNTSENVGGVAYFDSATGRIVDSTIEGNFGNTFGGGLGIYTGSSLTVEDTLVTNNTATFFGGGADLFDGGTLTCTGSSSTTAGFHSNNASLYGGAVGLDESATTNRFTASACDFGAHLGTTDNELYDIVAYDSDLGTVSYGYFADDDETFTCTGGQCGSSTAYSHNSTFYATYNSRSSAYFRGNYYEVTGTPTLDQFSMFLTTDADCLVDLYAHGSTDGGASWFLLYAEEVLARSGGSDVTSSTIGVPLNDGEQVLLSAGWDGSECGDSVRYDAYSTTIGSSVGFGTFKGRTMDNAYTGLDTTYSGFGLSTASNYGYEITTELSAL